MILDKTKLEEALDRIEKSGYKRGYKDGIIAAYAFFFQKNMELIESAFPVEEAMDIFVQVQKTRG